MTQQYRTAEQLGITEQEREALIATIDVLREEQIGFDMGEICTVSRFPGLGRGDQPCNSNCCIGGAMSILMQNGMKLPERITPDMSRVAHDYVAGQEPNECRPAGPFYDLFFDETNSRITPSSGITAIKRFLSGKVDTPWSFDIDYREP